MDPPTTLSLPFSTKYGVWKKVIEDRIKQLRVSYQLVKYKQIFSTYSLGDWEKDNDDDDADLICPRINYRSYGKSSIDVLPFADTIAEVTAKACRIRDPVEKKEGVDTKRRILCYS